MKANDNKTTAAEVLAATPAGGYAVTTSTAKLLDCLRAGSAYYEMLSDAIQARYAGVLTPDEAEAKMQPYLLALEEIDDLLHDEIRGSIVDAFMDVKNTAADTIRI